MKLPMFPGYQTLAVLGNGGMGVVYKVRRRTDGGILALKTLRSDVLANARPEISNQIVERFHREYEVAQHLGRLHGGHWVRVYEKGESHGLPFFTMEFLEGGTLHDLLGNSGSLPLDDAIWVTQQAAIALQLAHQEYVIYRDLKLGNIFLRGSGSSLRSCEIVLGDCGICRDEECEVSLTATGQPLGTPFWMAPEQIHRQVEVSARTDVWALGILLYRLLTGCYPFVGRDAYAIFALIETAEPSPLDAPWDLQSLYRRCLAKDPNDRWPSAGEVARRLGQIGRVPVA